MSSFAFIPARVLLLVAFLAVSGGVVHAEPALVAASAPGLASPSPAPAAPVQFDPPSIQFGVLAPGESASRSVTVTNLLDQPLHIEKVATCNCVEVRASSMTIPPRGRITLKATMTPKSGTGDKKEQIKLAFTGLDSTAIIDLTAEVALAVRVAPSQLDARQANSGTVAVESIDGRPFRVLAAAGKPPVFVGFNPAVDPPCSRYELRWDLDSYSQATMPGWWVIETDRADAPVVDARIWHEWTKTPRPPGRKWVPGDQRLLVGAVKAGEPVEVQTKLQYPRGSTPPEGDVKVSSLSSRFKASLLRKESIDSDILVTMLVTPLPGQAGLIYGPLEIIAPDGSSHQPIVIGRLME